MTTDFQERARRPRNAVEPVAAGVSFAPEAAPGSYPQRIAGVYNVGGGPHFGSGLTLDTAAELYGKRV